MLRRLYPPALLMLSLLGCSDDKPKTGMEGVDSGAGQETDSGYSCDGMGTLRIAVTVDGTPPGDVANFRALVRSGEEEPLQVALDADAIAEVTLPEGAYSIRAVALDGYAEAAWQDFVPVLECLRTDSTVDMVGIGRHAGCALAHVFMYRAAGPCPDCACGWLRTPHQILPEKP